MRSAAAQWHGVWGTASAAELRSWHRRVPPCWGSKVRVQQGGWEEGWLRCGLCPSNVSACIMQGRASFSLAVTRSFLPHTNPLQGKIGTRITARSLLLLARSWRSAPRWLQNVTNWPVTRITGGCSGWKLEALCQQSTAHAAVNTCLQLCSSMIHVHAAARALRLYQHPHFPMQRRNWLLSVTQHPPNRLPAPHAGPRYAGVV